MPSLHHAFTLKRVRATCFALPLTLLTGQALAAGDGTWKNGQEVYAKVCGHCHEAKIGPVITGRQLPPQLISAIVRNGLRAMPAFPASFIDDQALQAVGEYIQNSPAAAAKP